MRRVTSIVALLTCVLALQAQPSVRYWFDQQPSKQVLAAGATSLDCSSLPTGIHFVHFQTTDADGMLGPVRSQAFLVFGENLTPSSPSSVRYWFDQQPSKQVLAAGATSLDCSSLPTGVHALHFQLIDGADRPCPVRTQYFVNLDFRARRLSYWFDNDSTRCLMDIDGTEIPVDSLSNGAHTLHVQLADSHGGVMSAETMTAAFTIVCPDGEHVDADHDGLCDVCGEPFCYVRAIAAGSYGTLCLPRGADAGRFSGATFYSVAGKRTDGHGNPLSVVLRQADALAAGTPYFFVGTDSLLQVVYSGDAVSDTVSVNGLTGTLAGCDVPEGMYLLDGDELAECGSGCTLGACRAYLDLSAVPDYEEGEVEPDRMAVIAIAGADALRALHVEGDELSSYDLSGLRIPRGTRGITIVNGRKVLSR